MMLLAVWAGALFLITVHEFGHAYAAHRCGITIEEMLIGMRIPNCTITFDTRIGFPIVFSPLLPLMGGCFMLTEDYLALSSRQRHYVDLAGVVVNVVLAVLIGAIGLCCTAIDMQYLYGSAKDPTWLTNTSYGLYTLAYYSVVVAGFNILPIFGLDGGRVLRTVMKKRSYAFQNRVLGVTTFFSILLILEWFLIRPPLPWL